MSSITHNINRGLYFISFPCPPKIKQLKLFLKKAQRAPRKIFRDCWSVIFMPVTWTWTLTSCPENCIANYTWIVDTSTRLKNYIWSSDPELQAKTGQTDSNALAVMGKSQIKIQVQITNHWQKWFKSKPQIKNHLITNNQIKFKSF